MSNRPIGVFDSGRAGLWAVRELRRLLPGEEVVFLSGSDLAGRPAQTPEEWSGMGNACVRALAGRNVKALACACPMMSAFLDEWEERPDLPLAELAGAAARSACAVSAQGKIGLVADMPVLQSGVFQKALRSIQPAARVTGNAVPELLAMTEEGRAPSGAVRKQMESALRPLVLGRIDTLLLGSVQLSPLYEAACELLHYRMVVDPAAALARELQSLLLGEGLLSGRESGGAVRLLEAAASPWGGEPERLLGEIPWKTERMQL